MTALLVVGTGMVMLYQPLKEALESLPKKALRKVVYLSPQGTKWNYKRAREYAQQNHRGMDFHKWAVTQEWIKGLSATM